MGNGSRASVHLVGLTVAGLVAGLGIVAPPAHAQPPSVATAPNAPPVAARTARAAQPGVKVGVVKVSGVEVSRDRRTVSADVSWNRALIARAGKHDRFNVRLLAGYTVLADISDKVPRSRNKNVRIKLSKTQAKTLRAAKSAVLSVSQQHDSPTDGDSLFERNLVTTTHLTRSSTRTSQIGPTQPAPLVGLSSGSSRLGVVPRGACSSVLVLGAPIECDLVGANLNRADLYNANLSYANLTSAMLGSANLSYANLSYANLTNAALANANMSYAYLSNANLTNSILAQGKVSIDDNPVAANLSWAILAHADLSGALMAVFTGWDWKGVNLTGANLIGATCSNTTVWADGTSQFPGPYCPGSGPG